MFESAPALAEVGAPASMEVAVADGEGGLPEHSATLSAGTGRLGAPSCVHPLRQSPLSALVLEQG